MALGLLVTILTPWSVWTSAATVPEDDLVLVGHNGPRGLGSEADAPFGRDFLRPSIDFGDEDQMLALTELRLQGRRVLATVAGHMHEEVQGGGMRRRVVLERTRVELLRSLRHGNREQITAGAFAHETAQTFEP